MQEQKEKTDAKFATQNIYVDKPVEDTRYKKEKPVAAAEPEKPFVLTNTMKEL